MPDTTLVLFVLDTDTAREPEHLKGKNKECPFLHNLEKRKN